MELEKNVSDIVRAILNHHKPYKESEGVYFCRESACGDFWPCEAYVRTAQVADIYKRSGYVPKEGE